MRSILLVLAGVLLGMLLSAPSTDAQNANIVMMGSLSGVPTPIVVNASGHVQVQGN